MCIHFHLEYCHGLLHSRLWLEDLKLFKITLLFQACSKKERGTSIGKQNNYIFSTCGKFQKGLGLHSSVKIVRAKIWIINYNKYCELSDKWWWCGIGNSTRCFNETRRWVQTPPQAWLYLTIQMITLFISSNEPCFSSKQNTGFLVYRPSMSRAWRHPQYIAQVDCLK